MHVTIKDIAERAGVSMMTVSRVINNSGYVATKTRETIEQVIAELNYRPNLLARGLINKKSSFISVIVPDISNPFYGELTKGVETVARQHGYNIILSSAHWEESLEREHIEAALSRMAEGIILVLPKISSRIIAKYAQSIPIVLVDKYSTASTFGTIYVNQKRGVQLGIEHLISLGHTRIAYLSGSEYIYNSLIRQQGYESTLLKHGIPIDETIIFKGDFTFESGEQAFASMLKLPKRQRPTALFAASDLMALGFIRGAVRNSLRIPEDISIVGFDDIFLASVINPPLTTVRHPYIKMGQEAMKHLLCTLGVTEESAERPVLENTLIVRETTAPVSR